MQNTHLFHKCNWCHVIDTIVQLYVTVGLGIKLKSMSVRSWRWTSLYLPQNPLIAARVLLKRANLSFVLMLWHWQMLMPPCVFQLFCQSFALLHSCAIPPVVKTRGLNEDFSMSITVWLYLSFSCSTWKHDNMMLLVDLCQGLPGIWLWGRMCCPYVKESFLTAIPQSSRRDIQPCLHCQQCWLFFDIHFQWLVEVWFLSEHPYRLISLSVPLSLSLSCASLKCNHLVCIWGCDPQSLSFQKHSEWVCLSPSIHISCRLHLWILVYSVHIQSLWLAKLTAKKMPLFLLLRLWVVVTQGSFPAKVHRGCFWIFLLLYSVFCVSGELLVRGVVVKIELLSVDFVC